MCDWQLSLNTFTANVINLAVENCLISDLPTILTPSTVIRMSEERLKELASESEEVQLERQTLLHEVKILRSGLEKCQRSRQHERTGGSSTIPAKQGSTANSRVTDAYTYN
jgi:hypothetical protein